MPYLPIMLSVILLLSFTSTAYAYIDMGTGSYLVQMLLASLLAVGVGIRVFWEKIKSIFSPKTSNESQKKV